MYENIKLHSRKLGHLSAVYCVLYDRTGEAIFTVRLLCNLSFPYKCTERFIALPALAVAACSIKKLSKFFVKIVYVTDMGLPRQVILWTGLVCHIICK